MNSQPATLNPSLMQLRRFARRDQRAVERCQLCSVALPVEHRHLIQPEDRRLVCSCDACAQLFPNRPELKYRCIPRDARRLPDFRMSQATWDSLLIPINMAFFFYSSPADHVVAMYPGPAGATESLLRLESWNDVVRDNPVLETMQPDVEALLVNRLDRSPDGSSGEYYLAPIDKCYKLVGLMRVNWRGLSGGSDVWRAIQSYFETLKGEAS